MTKRYLTGDRVKVSCDRTLFIEDTPLLTSVSSSKSPAESMPVSSSRNNRVTSLHNISGAFCTDLNSSLIGVKEVRAV